MTMIREAIPSPLLNDSVTPAVPSRLLQEEPCLAVVVAVAETTA
jgi:hypothetical protein